MGNPNDAVIKEVQAVRAGLEKREPRSPFIAGAIGGLRAAEDNLLWDGEATLKQESGGGQAGVSGQES